MNYVSNIIRGLLISLFFVVNAGTAFAGGGDLPPLAVVKTCPATAKPGEIITCTIKITNTTWDQDYWEIQANEVVPAKLTFINENLPRECKIKNGGPHCSYSPHNRGTDKIYTFKFKVNDNAACDSTITNQVDVSAKDAPTNWGKADIKVKCQDTDKPQCTDGKDNDGDGWIDNDDSCCVKTGGKSESCDDTKPQCSDGKDNDGDGWIDLDDSGCIDANDNDETNITPNDGGLGLTITGPTTARKGEMIFLDFTIANNTGGGLWNVTLDYPLPAGALLWTVPAGCKKNASGGFNCYYADLPKGNKKVTAKIKIHEQCIDKINHVANLTVVKPKNYFVQATLVTVVTDCAGDKPQCKDGKDNDGDGWIDLDDSCCISATHDSEACTPGKPKITKTGPEWVKPGDIATYIVRVTNTGTTKLTGLGAGDHFPAPYNTLFTYIPAQSSPECTQYVQDGLTVYGCGFFNLNASETKEFRFTYKVPHDAPCGVQVVDQGDVSVPGGTGDWAKFMTLIKCETKPQCSDGKDNDGDGWIDLDDSGCDNPQDDDETNKPECKDGKDNDKDGWIDNDDSCCVQTGGTSETCVVPDKPECQDGKDNDKDGWIDNDDSCCIQTNGKSETCTPKPQCSDGKDNDGDGWIDLDDSGCDGPNDDDESDKPQCKDGKDNDKDGKIDFPADPGCDSAHDNDETDKPQCSDGKDNDGDGKTDHPNDPGCDNPQDDDEWNSTTSPILPISECVYDLGNGKYRAYFGYENAGSQPITIQAGTSSASQVNIFTPGEANRGQVSVFETGRKKAVFSVNFDGESLTWKVQPAGGDLKTVTVTKHTQACKPVKPIAECRDKKNSKFLTYFGYQNDNQFEIKLSIPAENKFIPAPEDRAQPNSFFPGRVVNAFSVNSDSDLTWKLATESTFTTAHLPACNPNSAPKCSVVAPQVAQCQGDQTRVPLSASQASDPDSDTLTYKWSTDCVGGTISDPTAANPDLILNTSDGQAKNCGVWLVVNDGSNSPVTCDQTVKVSACDKDCSGTSNGDAEIDLCGVCNGNNACVDCKGVPNGGAKFDQCGVCGGSNACADCAGVPGGSAKRDQCGVCNGNGKSCLDCSQSDQNDKKLTLDIGVNQQRLLVLKLTQRLQNASNNDKKFNKIITDALNRSELLYQESWRTVWTQLPGTTVNCNNSSLCQQSDLSASLASYDADSIELRDISLNLLRQIGSLRGKNDKKSKQNDKKYAQQANQLYTANAAVLATYPRFTSTCQ